MDSVRSYSLLSKKKPPVLVQPAPKLRIVSIGGGTGLSTLLRGLKRHVASREEPFAPIPLFPGVEITAIVTVTDDGGSSGRLRRDFDVLPPGDIRNCMVALSEDEALLSKLFQYRFASGRGLKDHSFGNLFLIALSDLTGDFAQAVRFSSEILASAGHIYPATKANVVLEAKLANGRVVAGESRISKSRSRIEEVRLRPRSCKPLKEAIQAIERADLITFGPGSLYTSVIPNLLVNGVAEAVEASLAHKAYFVNLMWQPGETTGFAASDHVAAIQKHAGRSILDSVIVNTTPIRSAQLRKYAEQNAEPVLIDIDVLRGMGLDVVGAPLARERNKVRHDPAAAAHVAVKLAQIARQSRNGVAPKETVLSRPIDKKQSK